MFMFTEMHQFWIREIVLPRKCLFVQKKLEVSNVKNFISILSRLLIIIGQARFQKLILVSIIQITVISVFFYLFEMRMTLDLQRQGIVKFIFRNFLKNRFYIAIFYGKTSNFQKPFLSFHSGGLEEGAWPGSKNFQKLCENFSITNRL